MGNKRERESVCMRNCIHNVVLCVRGCEDAYLCVVKCGCLCGCGCDLGERGRLDRQTEIERGVRKEFDDLQEG